MKYKSILIATLCAGLCCWGVELAVWIGMKEGLIAFLGLIAAAVFQVIPVTANFLGNDELTPHEADLLTKALDRQQRFWVGMLAVTMMTFVFVVVGAALEKKLLLPVPRIGSIDFAPVMSGLIGWCFGFLLSRMLPLMRGVLGLQRLRSSLVIAAAKRRAAEKAAAVQASIQPPPNLVPDDYGQIEKGWPPH